MIHRIVHLPEYCNMVFCSENVYKMGVTRRDTFTENVQHRTMNFLHNLGTLLRIT